MVVDTMTRLVTEKHERLRVSTRKKRHTREDEDEGSIDFGLKKRKYGSDTSSEEEYPSPEQKKRRFRAAVSGPPAGRVPHSNAVFPKKLREICESPACRKAILWDDEIGGLIIRNPSMLRNEILPNFFRGKGGKETDVYRSFRRQLVYYGFEEVTRRGGSSSPLVSLTFASSSVSKSVITTTPSTLTGGGTARALDPETMQPVSVCVNKDPRIRRLSDLDSCRRYVTQYDHDKKKQLLISNECDASTILDDPSIANTERPSSSSSLASLSSFPQFLSSPRSPSRRQQDSDDEYHDTNQAAPHTASDHQTVAAILFSMRTDY